MSELQQRELLILAYYNNHKKLEEVKCYLLHVFLKSLESTFL